MSRPFPPRPHSLPESEPSLRASAVRLAAGDPGWLFSFSTDESAPTGTLPTVRRELAVDDPEDLLGITAPAHWSAVAFVLPTAEVCAADGEAEHEADGGAGGTLAVVLDRHASVAVAVALAGGPAQSVDTGAGISGLLADLLHRVLGLPTEPEATSPAALIVSVWLHNLLDAAADPDTAGSVATWSGVVGEHPAWRAGGGELRVPGHVGTHDPDELAALTRDLARRLPWERMRSLAADAAIDVPGLEPGHAAWMDWPFFARWTLDVHRPVTELLDDLSLFVDGPLLRDVRYTVESVGWLGFAGSHASESTGDE